MPIAGRVLGAVVAVIMLATAAWWGGSEMAGVSSGPSGPPAGVVAVVDGDEIPEAVFERQYQQILAIPSAAEHFSSQPETAGPILRAQVLSQLLMDRILFRAAQADFGITVTDEEIRARLRQMKDEAGDEEEFLRQLAESGLTEAVLVEQELPFSLMINQVRQQLAGQNGGPASPAPTGEPGPDPTEVAVQQWALAHFARADVSIRSEFGTWDPASGQVRPAVDPEAVDLLPAPGP